MIAATLYEDVDLHVFSGEYAFGDSLWDDDSDQDIYDTHQPLVLQSSIRLQHETTELSNGRREEVPDRTGRFSGSQFKGMDDATLLVLQDLMKRRVLDQVQTRFHSSATAHIYLATGQDNDTGEKVEYAVKVFRNADQCKLKMRARREFYLLSRARSCRVNAPIPVLCEEHILVTTFIGQDHTPVPALALALDDVDDREDYEAWHCYAGILASMRRLYQDARLVHSNVNGHNILYSEITWDCWLTDLGSAVDRENPDHKRLLIKDIARVQAIFRRAGLGKASKTRLGLLPDHSALAFVTLRDPTESISSFCCWEKW